MRPLFQFFTVCLLSLLSAQISNPEVFQFGIQSTFELGSEDLRTASAPTIALELPSFQVPLNVVTVPFPQTKEKDDFRKKADFLAAQWYQKRVVAKLHDAEPIPLKFTSRDIVFPFHEFT